MNPYFHDDHLTVYQGDCREVMAAMEPESVHCVVTSPPYWGLRDYGIGEKGIGLEPTPEAFVANMVDVFREVRRVLRKDGTLWLNLGDSYATGTFGRNDDDSLPTPKGGHKDGARPGYGKPRPLVAGLKPKDLVGIPWRVAFALQTDGWYLRSDIIWSKPNPMPESVTDRPTKAHEYLFLLTKSARYYYDADAVREADSGLDSGNGFAGRQGGARQTAVDGGDGSTERWRASKKPDGWATHDGGHGSFHKDGREAGEAGPIRGGRNLRSVWSIATEPYPGAHFATFPRKLVEPCVKAGTSERGVCPECGAPWVRETQPSERYAKYLGQGFTDHANDLGAGMMQNRGVNRQNAMLAEGITGKEMVTIGWRPSCDHTRPTGVVADPYMGGSLEADGEEPIPTVPGTVLDPFAGSGTTGMVAQALGRRAVLIDLSADYLLQLMSRNQQTPLGMIG